MSEGKVTGFSWYAGTETGDARVGGRYHAEAGQKKTAGDIRHNMAGGEGGEGSIRVLNNKQPRLGP